MNVLAGAEVVDDFAPYGIRAFTTSREAGSFGLGTTEPVREVIDRWRRLRDELRPAALRFASANQVHGVRVVAHSATWEGWLRVDDADGHAATDRGTALAVSAADCVPVFIAHPSGAIALLHSGWRGTAGGILDRGVGALAHRGYPVSELRVHLGPAICGACYEVSPDVYAQLTGRRSDAPATVDLRAIIAGQARALGVRHISVSALCTRCDNARLFSHRAGDDGRQLGVMVADAALQPRA